MKKLDYRKNAAGIVVAAFILGMSAAAAHAIQVAFPFERYEVILNRKPFGDDPPPPPPPPPPPVVEKDLVPGPGSYLKKVRMCAIRQMGGNGGALRIGLVDDNVKPPRSYFLYVGDMMDGIEVKDAVYSEKKVLVKREDEEFWIEMISASTPPPKLAAAGGAKALRTRTAVGRAAAAKTQPKQRRSYAERLRERRKQEELRRQVIAEEKAKLTKEELREFFRQQQMEIIRKGQPVLPIPLTKEMDDQLVAEGVLPPIEE